MIPGLTSPDGITWTRRISGTGNTLNAVGYGNGVFVTVRDYGTILEARTSTILSRLSFYNQSAFDGYDASANAADDGAIATDKSALLPGGTATFANYTSYSRGINGIMVDLSFVPGILSASDFTFTVGNDNNPAAWATTPAPSSITVLAGAGVGGSDRVTLIWPNNAIQKQWLEVTVLANANTGLKSPDVFYFGNALGECTGNESVSVQDVGKTKLAAGSAATITSLYDYNRDGSVSVVDVAKARENAGFALPMITAP